MISAIFVLSIIGSATGYFFLVGLPLSYFLIPVWLLAGLLTSLLVLLLILIVLMPIMKYTKPNTWLKYRFIKGAARFVNRFYLRLNIKVEGLENMPKTGKLTLYGNHKSNTDPIILAHHMNRAMAFTPKIQVYQVPILRNYMDYIGCLPIDRDDNRRTAKTMIGAINNVKAGLAMVIFPEGGIKDRSVEEMASVKAGAYRIGMKAESDFLPFTIIGASKIKDAKWYQRTKIKLIFHPVVKYEEVKDFTTAELADKMFDIINSGLEE